MALLFMVKVNKMCGEKKKLSCEKDSTNGEMPGNKKQVTSFFPISGSLEVEAAMSEELGEGAGWSRGAVGDRSEVRWCR